jgi:hypothetical protein
MSEDLMEKCGLSIQFGDDFGDNGCTFHCQLEKGHEGPHMEVGDMGWGKAKIPYTLSWQGSEEELNAQSEEAMQELTDQAQELGMGYDAPGKV